MKRKRAGDQSALAPAIRDGRAVAVPWATQIGLTITTRSGLGRPPPGVAQKNFVMMPVLHYRATLVAGCEEWHRDALHGVLVAYDVEPDGLVKNASVAQTSGDAAEDRDALDCVSRRTYKPATRDGTPVEIRVTAELFAGRRAGVGDRSRATAGSASISSPSMGEEPTRISSGGGGGGCRRKGTSPSGALARATSPMLGEENKARPAIAVVRPHGCRVRDV